MKIAELLTTVAVLPAAFGVIAAPARADEFGCTVMLCILNPQGWSSVGACVPPVEKAFSLVARGHPWPQCPEAGRTSGIGYEPYEPCPNGTVAVSPTGDSTYTRDTQGRLCGTPSRNTSFGGRDQSMEGFYSKVTERARRQNPNYMDITPTNGEQQRFWFNLGRYR